LAVTILVLLTGEEPQYFLGDGIGTPNWQRQAHHLSPNFKAVLEGMLAAQPVERYQSAAEVLQALSGAPIDFSAAATQPPGGYPAPVSYPIPVNYPEPSTCYPSPPLAYPDGGSTGTVALPPRTLKRSRQRKSRSGFGCTLGLLLLVGALAGAGWWLKETWLPLLINSFLPGDATNPSTTSSDFSTDEQTRKADLRDRQQALGVDPKFLIALTDASFIQRYPEQRGRTLTTDPSDAEWRSRWDAIATAWLDLLDSRLSPDARRRLGRYGKPDRDGWKRTVNQLYVSTRALNDLTDARFFYLFPEMRGQEFIDQPIGQVWQAIASDIVKALQADETLARIRFATGEFSQQASGTLRPGDGRMYIANLSQGQILRLRLQAPRRSTLLSIYLPRPTPENPFILEDSADMQWSGSLAQSGFYEIVVVSTAEQPLDYTLNLAVDNVTSSPIEPEMPEKPNAKN
jgi:serine/threonine protein kinase, bacterial